MSSLRAIVICQIYFENHVISSQIHLFAPLLYMRRCTLWYYFHYDHITMWASNGHLLRLIWPLRLPCSNWHLVACANFQILITLFRFCSSFEMNGLIAIFYGMDYQLCYTLYENIGDLCHNVISLDCNIKKFASFDWYNVQYIPQHSIGWFRWSWEGILVHGVSICLGKKTFPYKNSVIIFWDLMMINICTVQGPKNTPVDVGSNG